MLTWFALQKKETKILLIVGMIALLIVLYFALNSAYWKYQYFKGIEKEFKELVTENKQLQKDFQALYIERQELDKAIDKKNSQIDSLKNIAKNLKDEANKKPPIVRTYPDRKLDSIMSNYRHIQRSEN